MWDAILYSLPARSPTVTTSISASLLAVTGPTPHKTRTGKVEKLRKLYPAEAYIEINPSDAIRLNIEDGSKVTDRVETRLGIHHPAA